MNETNTIQENKKVVEAFLHGTHSGKIEVVDELTTPDVKTHGFPCANPQNRDDYKAFFAALDAAFPDMQFGIISMLGEVDKVAVHFWVEGTHSNEFMGIPRTGNPVSFTGMVIYRLHGGRIAETWLQPDNATLLKQLGVLEV